MGGLRQLDHKTSAVGVSVWHAQPKTHPIYHYHAKTTIDGCKYSTMATYYEQTATPEETTPNTGRGAGSSQPTARTGMDGIGNSTPRGDRIHARDWLRKNAGILTSRAVASGAEFRKRQPPCNQGDTCGITLVFGYPLSLIRFQRYLRGPQGTDKNGFERWPKI